MSDEKSDSSLHGEGHDLDSEHVGYFNQKNVVTLRSMREKVNWKTGKSLREFLDQLDSMISEWKGPLPNLREIFTQEEIDRLLTVSAFPHGNLQTYNAGKRFVDFVARSGYKDEPKVDENGKPLLNRTTALHSVCGFARHDFARELFDIYNRFDVNYTDHGGLTHFHAACASGHVAVIEKFLELGQDPDCLNATLNFRPPLYLALQWGHRKAVKTLLKNGANPNLADAEGLTPLHYICRKDKGHELLEMFFKINEELDKPLQIEVEDKKGRTPLHYALLNSGCKKQIVQLLLRNAAKNRRRNLTCNQGRSTPLHIICLKTADDDGVDLAKIFFEINGEFNQPWQVNAKDEMCRTALVCALASPCNVQMAEVLLRNGVDPNSADAAGCTPLHKICQFQSQDMAEQFLKICDEIQQSIEIDAGDIERNTPLHLALDNGNNNVAECLLRRDADPNSANAKGMTPLHFICQRRIDDGFVEKFFKICDDIQKTVVIDARDNKGNTPMHLALNKGNNNVAELLLRRDADPNSANAEGMTPLHFICQRKEDDSFVEKFFKICDDIQKTVVINARDNEGNTPLHFFMQNDYPLTQEGTELMLRRGADPNSANAKGLTPLHFICQRKNGRGFVVKFFKICDEIQKTVQVDARDNEGNTPLHLICDEIQKTVQIDARNNEWNTPLHLLMQNDNFLTIETLKLLLRRGTDPNSANAKGLTPLHIICQRYDDNGLVEKFYEICDEIQQSIEIDARDNEGNTPLHLAVDKLNNNLAKLLLRKGADHNSTNDKGLTPLHFICQQNTNDDLLEMFFKIIDEIQLTVEIDARDNEGNTPLHFLMQNIYLLTKETTELLLRRGADPNSANSKGLTPLHFICQHKIEDDLLDTFFEIIDEIQQPVEMDARDNEGNTPLHLALNKGNNNVAESLLRRGADPNSANAEGMTPLHFICQRKEDDGLVEKFFNICEDIQKTVQLDARDKLKRSPLQLAVGHVLLNGVKFLLDRGADLSSFVFPTASYFVEALNKFPWLDYFHKLRLMSGTLAIVELLEDKGYELDRDASLTIIKVFANYKYYNTFLDDFRRDDVYLYSGCVKEAKRIMVNPSLSLDEVVKLRPKEARKLLTFEDYYKLARLDEFYLGLDLFRDAYAEHLCEKLSRGVFQRWALDSFLELTRNRLPILCCEKIIDESLRKEDLWRIYVANCNLSEAEKSDPLMSVLLL